MKTLKNKVSVPHRSQDIKVAVKLTLGQVTLTLSAFMVLYVGSEVTIGGWLLTFMMNVRNGSLTASSLATSGFWIGITVGRFSLGWITGYVGEKVMVTVYLLSAIALELGFWFGDKFAVSAVMAALVGVSIGMIMPSVSCLFLVLEAHN